MDTHIYRLIKSINEKEYLLKVYLSDIKRWDVKHKELHLYRIRDEETNHMAWAIRAFGMDECGELRVFPRTCVMNKKSKFNTVLYLLADTGYKIHISNEFTSVHSPEIIGNL